MLLLEYVAQFAETAKLERRLAPTSIRLYASISRRYIRWLGEESRPPQFTPDSARRWLHSVSGKGVRPRTILQAIYALKAFGAYMVELGVYTQNPADKLPAPRLDPPERELLPDEVLTDCLSAADLLPLEYNRILTRAVLSVLSYAGLRRQELLDLKCEDLLLPEQAIVIRHGKGDKRRTVYPHADCITALRAYLRVRRPHEGGWLWTRGKGRRVCSGGLTRLLNQVCRAAGHEGKKLLPHSIRHNYATRLLKAGVDLVSIQTALGHANLATTSVYLHPEEKRLREAAQRIGLEGETKKDLPTKEEAANRLRRKDMRRQRNQ